MDRHLSLFKRAEIIVLYKQNVSIKEIARRLSISRKTIQLWVHRYTDLGHVNNTPPGPKPNASAPLHLDIVAAHATDPFLSTRSTAARHNVTLQTVRNHLRAAGLHCCRPPKKLVLTEQDRRKRVRFARTYLNFDWCDNVVIFTGEKSFKFDDGRKTLWRKKGECCNHGNILPCRTNITLHYWGWMSSMGPGELVEVGGLSSQEYLEVLEDVMLPTVRAAYPNWHIYFMHDNSPVHRKQIVKRWLSRQQDSLTVIDWPANSPDLNPIENLWGQMNLGWDPSDVQSKADLSSLVTSAWESIRGTGVCWNMVRGMRNQLQRVIDSDGAPITN